MIKDSNFSDGCFLYIVETSVSEITNWGWRLENTQPSTTVRFVRGNKAKTVNSFFNEVSAALQFPYYFGENWNAFRDCILDLDWISSETLVVVVTDSEQLLREEPLEQLRALIEYLQEAGEEFNLEGKNFFTLFQCDTNVKANVKSRLTIAGAIFREIKV